LDFVRALVFQALLLGQDPFLGVVVDLPPGPADPADGAPGGLPAGQDECPAGTGTDTQTQTGTPDQAEAAAQDRTAAANPKVTAAAVNAKTLAKIAADLDAEAQVAADRAVAASLTATLREALTDATSGVEKAHERVWLIAEAAHRIRDTLTALKIPGCTTHTTRDGQIMHGHDGYRPPATMRRAIQARDERCMFPGCRRPSLQCDLDHSVAYHVGGKTCACNMAALCRHHHRCKGTGRWTLIHLWPGVLLWITPTAHWYLTGPDP
ncbi:MAG TPA: HNH endonuclease signature motif containing protein, partial [Streptosporangiaceae bacterium]|nr:HNH endonuclease signature motif containing protein [Streptosporangiaceae bacterium]